MTLKDFPPTSMEDIRPANENTSLLDQNKSGNLNDDLGNLYVHKRKRKTWPIVFIILTITLERAAYYGILSNLALFLSEDLKQSRLVTVVSVFLFCSMAWLMSTIGGVVGDSYTGRFKAILGSLIIYIVGAVLLEIIANCVGKETHVNVCKSELSNSQRTGFIVGVLFLISIGEGAFKANITAFGAEQIAKKDDKTFRVYFNWFYWGINIGCFTGFSVVAFTQQYYGFVIGYCPPLACLVLACIVFVIPKSIYIVCPLSANVFKKAYNIMREARAKKRSSVIRRGCPGLVDVMPMRSWLDRAMIKYGGSYLDTEVEEVKTLCKIGMMFLILAPYWMIYFQMNSTFLLQGLHMNLNFNSHNFSNNVSCEKKNDRAIIPAASLSLADVVIILLVIPLMDKVVYPWLDRRGWEITLSKRILVGFLFAIASMISAGVVEHFRHELVQSKKHTLIQCINLDSSYAAANMSIFYQIPQYSLIGISEVFASVASLEWAYQEAPESMHGFVMGLFFLVQSLANILGAALYAFSSDVLGWISKNRSNKAHLGNCFECYFYLLGGIMFVNWLILVVLSVKIDFKYQKEKHIVRRQGRLSNKHRGSYSKVNDSYTSVVT